MSSGSRIAAITSHHHQVSFGIRAGSPSNAQWRRGPDRRRRRSHDGARDVVLEHRVELRCDLHRELVEALLQPHLRQRQERPTLRERHVVDGADEALVAVDPHGGRRRDAGVERDLQLERRFDLGLRGRIELGGDDLGRLAGVHRAHVGRDAGAIELHELAQNVAAVRVPVRDRSKSRSVPPDRG